MPAVWDTNTRIFGAYCRLFFTRFKRIIFAVPIATTLTVVGTMVGIWLGSQKAPAPSGYHWLYYLAVLTGLLVVSLQTWINHQRLKYDVTIALKYEQKFFKESKPERLTAAKAILRVLDAKTEDERLQASKNSEIEPVLDIIEDIGFLVQCDQISDEVAHHYFYHWIRLYIQPLQQYFATLSREGAAEYKYTLLLFDRVRFIEGREKGWSYIRRFSVGDLDISEDELRTDLNDEIEDCDDSDGNS